MVIIVMEERRCTRTVEGQRGLVFGEVIMPRLQSKTFDAPDEVRSVPKAKLQVINLGETTVGFAAWEPGWRWSTDLGPIIGTEWCENHHLGYSLSGTLEVVTEAGDRLEIKPRSAYEIPPRHDGQHELKGLTWERRLFRVVQQ